MSNLMYVQKLVKSYFDSVVILDDELENEKQPISKQENTGSESRNSTMLNTQQEVDNGNIELEIIELTDADLGPLPEDITAEINELINVFGAEEEMAATSASDATKVEPYNNFMFKPTEVYHKFVEEGFITLAHNYDYKNHDETLSYMRNVLSTTKMLVIDWNLEYTNIGEMGRAAIEFLNLFVESNNRLKCAVIYTREDDEDVVGKLNEQGKFKIKDFFVPGGGKLKFFQQIEEKNGNSLLGFIISKNCSPEDIIKNIATLLLEDKSITVHFMESANRLETNLHKAMALFNEEFDKVVLMQMITSDLPKEGVPEFLNQILFSTVYEYPDKEFSHNFMLLSKKKRLAEVLKVAYWRSRLINQSRKVLQKFKSGDKTVHGELLALKNDIEWLQENKTVVGFKPLLENVKKLAELLNIKDKDGLEAKFRNKVFVEKVLDVLSDPDVTSLHDYREAIFRILNLLGQNASQNQKITTDIVILSLLFESFVRSPETFVESFKKENARFTRLMKYKQRNPLEDENSNIIETGSIWRKKQKETEVVEAEEKSDKGNKSTTDTMTRVNELQNTDTFLMCITPVCDTYRADKKVENFFKFVVGVAIQRDKAKKLQEDSQNSESMAVPLTNQGDIQLIEWKYYNALTLKKDDVLKDYELILTLKKDYSQKSINRYSSYHMRAGVEEMFYKESSYKNYFKHLF